MTETDLEGIAIVGMAGRFPGAPSVDAFWRNIKDGVESITHFDRSEAEIDAEGGGDDDKSHFVCAKGMLDDVDMFDARFFGYLPREAEVMDPQHRIFLEICWEAMEVAGYDCSRYPGAVGVFGGCYMDTYILWNLCSDDNFRRRLVESIQVGTLQTELGNDKDYLATRVAYKLGLRGPAMTLQTACSTSLVAVATACQSLDSYQSDMALAGGVTLILPQKKGYYYKEGGMLSPDGHCRTFDEKAAGTVFSHGAAVVLLKRLADAIADRDTIYGVIRGYAANNDGGDKVSYTAPSVEGQAEAVATALGLGQIDARTIGYVEAHGTATPLGDPIEIGGLTKAYREFTDDTQYCAIGSVKANLGHLDVASGAIGLIKSTLALHEKVLPPQINFDAPNPKIGIEKTPFYVNTDLTPWPAQAWPRRAAVSSFGVGGTNAHVVLEEAPEIRDHAPAAHPIAQGPHLFTLSARTQSALEAQVAQFADHLERHPDVSLRDAAYTLQIGRKAFDYRVTVVASDREAAVAKLRQNALPARKADKSPQLIFMFPGQGAQYPGMGRELYDQEPVFKETVDRVAATLTAVDDVDFDIRDFLNWSEATSAVPLDDARQHMAQTRIAQPAIYAIEVGVAKLLMSWGLTPTALLGHSIGEFAAAAIADVFSVEDGAMLVAERGRQMQAMAPGSMLAIMANDADVADRLPEGVCRAAINSPTAVVVSGPTEAIDAFADLLDREQIKSTKLATSHAFHSSMMAPARAPLEEAVAATARRDANIQIFSTLTGDAVAADRFADPGYWGEQLVSPVRFADALQSAAGDADRVFVEIGPGQSLRSFAAQTLKGDAKRPAFCALGPVRDPGSDCAHALGLIGDLWSIGATPNWEAIAKGAPRRVALPTYPFERKRHWIEPSTTVETATPTPANAQLASQPSNHGVQPNAALTGDADDLERLIQEQLKLISTQIDLMGRG